MSAQTRSNLCDLRWNSIKKWFFEILLIQRQSVTAFTSAKGNYATIRSLLRGQCKDTLLREYPLAQNSEGIAFPQTGVSFLLWYNTKRA